MAKFTALSGYRIMWVMALFDLPVLNKEGKRPAEAALFGR
jgi:hypothetical protein